MDNTENDLRSDQPTKKVVSRVEVPNIVEIAYFEDGTHEHRPHVHTKHKIAMFINIQAPDELMPRKIVLNFCEGCHLAWWEELK